MLTLVTERLLLVALDARAAERVLAGRPVSDEPWLAGYPSADEIGPLRLLAQMPPDPADRGDSAGWGPWQIRRRDATGVATAIGGIELKGGPDAAGAVEVGYSLVRAARGSGLAAEALTALTRWALHGGARQVYGDTAADNVASQQTLRRAGFRPVGSGVLRRFVTSADDRVGRDPGE